MTSGLLRDSGGFANFLVSSKFGGGIAFAVSDQGECTIKAVQICYQLCFRKLDVY